MAFNASQSGRITGAVSGGYVAGQRRMKAQSKYIKANGIEHHYLDWGNPSGRTLPVRREIRDFFADDHVLTPGEAV